VYAAAAAPDKYVVVDGPVEDDDVPEESILFCEIPPPTFEYPLKPLESTI
jgi:hypothetical protein